MKLGGTHTIRAEKEGYHPKEISIYVERVVEQLNIRDKDKSNFSIFNFYFSPMNNGGVLSSTPGT